MSKILPNLTELQELTSDKQQFLLRVVQPGLSGLMDGSVSTLAPIFATAFATQRSHTVFRGLVTGGMTFLGGFLHTLPFLIQNVHTALTWAYLVVGVELLIISWIRYRYMKTSFVLSCLQVIVGGGLVFAAGVLIGSS